MGHSEFITDKLKRIVSQISGKPDKDMPLIPEFVVKGKGVIYCLAPDMRSFNKVTRGIPVYVVVGNYNNSGRGNYNNNGGRGRGGNYPPNNYNNNMNNPQMQYPPRNELPHGQL